MNGVLVIAASRGGLEPLRRIIAAVPVPSAAAIFVVVHIGPNRSSLPQLLNADRGQNHAVFAEDNAPIKAGCIYVAPPDHHMLLEPGRMRLSRGPKVHHTRPAADPLFMSAASVYGPRVMGIVLSGGDSDGAAGLQTIADHGGITLVQRPDETTMPAMPLAAIIADDPDACLTTEELAQRVRSFCSSGVDGAAAGRDAA